MANRLFVKCCVVLALCYAAGASSCYGQPRKAAPEGGGFALIELYTSEGCSSCPAADALMPRLKDAYKGQLYVLEFHVDYWNRLGWTDPYSSAAYSARQNNYAAAKGSDNVYTPEAVVNGKNDITGSDRVKLQQLIDRELQAKTPEQNIQLSAKGHGATVSVTYSAALGSNEVLNIALVQLHAATDVQKGENEGRHLQHDYIVRRFETVHNNNGTLTIDLPQGLSAAACHLVAYTQQATTQYVTGVTEVDIAE